MIQQRPHDDRRRHLRFPLGLPVMIHVEGREDSMTVEIVDIAVKGARFRSAEGALPVDQRASFGFVTSGQTACVANGRVVRVDDDGDFILSVEHANPAFLRFVDSLST